MKNYIQINTSTGVGKMGMCVMCVLIFQYQNLFKFRMEIIWDGQKHTITFFMRVLWSAGNNFFHESNVFLLFLKVTGS
jgi:hypothetical protein